MRVHLKSDATAPRSGVMGQISFNRLLEMLRAAGEVRENETVSDMIVDVRDGVIQYVVRTNT